MTENTLPLRGDVTFEEMKRINDHGVEYWSARDLQPLLGYSQWRRFEDAVQRAITSCRQSGNEPDYHFAGAGKPITGGKGAVQVVDDYHLSRFACYLIAQNGDSRKPEIANAQKYFAIKARRQELSDALTADKERLEIRKQTSEEFKDLSGAAREAGVQDRMFGVFHDAGYKGLYDGLGNDAIKQRKGIAKKENLMDRMDALPSHAEGHLRHRLPHRPRAAEARGDCLQAVAVQTKSGGMKPRQGRADGSRGIHPTG